MSLKNLDSDLLGVHAVMPREQTTGLNMASSPVGETSALGGGIVLSSVSIEYGILKDWLVSIMEGSRKVWIR